MSQALEARLRRADPTAYVHVDAVAVDAESSKRTVEQWEAATGSGWESVATGGVRLTGSVGALVEHTTSTGYLEDLEPGVLSPFEAIRIRWNGPEPSDLVLHRLKLYLHPRVDGGAPQEVVTWRVRCFAVRRINIWAAGAPGSGSYDLELVPLGDYVDVAATGAAGLVTFDFQGLGVFGRGIRPKKVTCERGTPPILVVIPAVNDYLNQSVTFVKIYALTATGAAAGNVGLGYDSGTAEKDTGGNALATREITWHAGIGGQGVLGGYLDNGDAGGAPRMAVEVESYSAATATFEDAGNRLDLGAVPTGTVEFLARGEVPPGTSLTFEVRNDADSAWVAFEDGDTTDDLAGVGLNQTYKVRVTLTPDSGGDTTPIARVIGVREIARRSLVNLTTIEGPRWSLDPRTLKGEIGEARLTVIRDGAQDFYDAITDLLATYDVGALTFEVFVADPNLDRGNWLHVDTFTADDLEYGDGGITVLLVSHLARLRQALPRPELITTTGASLTFVARGATDGAQIQRAAGSFVSDGYQAGDAVTVSGSTSNDGVYVVAEVAAAALTLERGETLSAEGPTSAPTLSVWVRRPYEQASQTLHDVWADLADAQLAIPGRMRGPGVDDDTTTVTKTVRDGGDAKDELDAIAAIAGGANISSQGQVKFTGNLFAAGAVVALFPSNEIEVLELTPGLRYRVPESWIDYDWDDSTERFRAQVRGVNTAALTGLGEAYLEPARLDDAVAKWVTSDTLAQALADRDVRFRGTGIPSWRFRSTYCYPELEPGDLVAVETEKFVFRDPVTAAAVRGRLWALGLITAVEGCEGRDFTIWIRQFADYLPTYTTYDLTPSTPLTVEAYFTPAPGNPGQTQVRIAGPIGATLYYVVQDWQSAVPAYGAAAWQTYTAPFGVAQLEDVDRQLSVYAERGGVRSVPKTWRIDRDTEPEVSVVLSEPTANTVRVSWTPDDDVVYVRLYLATNAAGNGFPTLDNNSDGILDQSLLVGTLHVREDGGSWDGAGSPLAGVLDSTGTARTGIGGTRWQLAGFSGSDVVKVVVVPVDRMGNVGTRATGSITVGGSATAALTAFSAAKTAAGSGCGVNGAQITVSWTVNASVADVTHDLRIYRRNSITGMPSRQLVQTEASPVTTTTYVDTVDDQEDVGSGYYIHWIYDYELVAGSTVLDSGEAPPVKIESSGLCPLS